ncbi:MAG: YgiQ family radical SAM protein [Candidatus Omnitrophica bacterium]|nr:YgiQ family radical SAM protein [Candidatus Omnitrophota bacterium]
MNKHTKDRKDFLITQPRDLSERGIEQCDVIIVTGDAYVDHPSYGTAVIGRVLEDAGFVVGIIAQPNWRRTDDFARLGRPRLFFGITSGNTDSMIANYTANKKIRSNDEYAPGNRGGMRPDHAVLVYANRLREAYKDVPLILGGIEASLRRFAHYDYWDNTVRRSILIESRADILVYGMGEEAVTEIAHRLARGETVSTIDDIRGTVVIKKEPPRSPRSKELPSCDKATTDPDAYNRAFRDLYHAMDPYINETVFQKHDTRFVIQNPPRLPMATKELDHIYELPYAYDTHPDYDEVGGVPGFESVKCSIVSHRGCAGECAFCSLFFHQGRIVQSRSEASIMREVQSLIKRPYFRGTITDIGGPTANMYGTHCKKWEKTGYCENKKCLLPEKCTQLTIAYDRMLTLYRRIRSLKGVKHVFIGSGFRYDLLIEPEADELLRELCEHHVSGLMKIAPEHCSDTVLDVMQKPHFKQYETFVEKFKNIARSVKKKVFIVNYFISAHPQATLNDQLKLALYCAKRNIHPEQIQDFIPSPMTLSTCIYYTGKHPFTGKTIYVPRSEEERKMHRALIQYKNKGSYPLIRKALEKMNMLHVMPKLMKTANTRPQSKRSYIKSKITPTKSSHKK